MKNRKRARGLFGTLVCWGMLCIGLYLLLGLATSSLSNLIWLRTYGWDTPDLTGYADELAAGDYKRIPFWRILGQDGYFEILDADGKVIYSSAGDGRTVGSGYTAGELLCIPAYGSQNNVSSPSSVNLTALNDGSGDTAVTFYDTGGEVSAFFVLDNVRRVVFGRFPDGSPVLSARQLALLDGTFEQDASLLQWPFAAADSSQHTLLLHCVMPTDLQWTVAFLISIGISLLYILIGVALFLVLLRVLTHQVKVPLGLLNRSLRDLADGKQTLVQYSGPAELEQICTSFNQMAQRLAESEARREKLEAGRQTLLADLSHDLKTPITVIRGYTDALASGLVPPDKQPQYLTAINRKATVLGELIESFHEFAKLEHPDFAPHSVDSDLCEFLREYLAEKYDEIDLAGYALDVDIPETPVHAMLDTALMRRALENLLANAQRHNARGTVITVALRPGAPGTRTLLVADDGCGIPPKAAENIFDPFVVGDDARGAAHGSGLGLAITKKIIVAHGGFIRLRTPPDDGFATEFEIVLPVEEPTA